jgi:hypothetical protein
MDPLGACCGVPGTGAVCSCRKSKDASAYDLMLKLLEENAVGKSE